MGTEQSTALAPQTETKPARLPAVDNGLADAFLNPARFEQLQRGAKVFADSDLVPDHMRGKVSNCVIALALAYEMGESPITVMQAINVVKGHAGWSAQYMIARLNRSGIIRGRLQWRIETVKGDMLVTAFATMTDTGEMTESPTVSLAMAKAEGWDRNPKYQSMPEVMLRYRAATFFVRMNCPEVMYGYHTTDEIEDVEAAGGGQRPALRRGGADLGSVLGMAGADPDVIDVGQPDPAPVPADAVTDEAGAAVKDPPEAAPEPRRTRRAQSTPTDTDGQPSLV
jgi:hypothetical protein